MPGPCDQISATPGTGLQPDLAAVQARRASAAGPGRSRRRPAAAFAAEKVKVALTWSPTS